MTKTFLDLYNEFLTFVDKNDEQGARDFLIKNLQKFPTEIQDKLTFAFFEEALINEAEGIKNVAEIQTQGIDALNQISKAKKILEEEKQVEDLRSKLTQ